MDLKILRSGIAGSGFAAKFHYEALRRVFGVNVQIAGAYSPNRNRLEQFTGARNIKAFKNLDELIANVDVGHVCSTLSTH